MSATLNTVARVELDRYLGTWFEICRLPLKWEPRGQATSPRPMA